MEVALHRVLITALSILLIGSFAFATTQEVQLSSTPNGANLVDDNHNGVALDFSVGSVIASDVSTKGGDFTLLAGQAMGRSQSVGDPNLPAIRRIIAIPEGCELDVQVLSDQTEVFDLKALGLTNPIMPVQPSLSKSDDPMSVPFMMNRAQYEMSGYYRQELVETNILGSMRGVRFAVVSVNPFEYSPTEGKVIVHTNVSINVSYVGADWAKTEDIRRTTYSPMFEPVFSRAINYEAQTANTKDDLVSYPVKYLIIADRMFEGELDEFIAWKVKKGFNVVLAYTDEIGSGSNTEITAYIESLYNSGTTEDPAPSFVLFVGDDNQIPAHDGTASTHITDLYFCEFTGDDFPEIYYGRFSAQNVADLTPQIDKTLEYEQYLMPDPSYLEYVTLVSGVDASHASTYGNGQINYGTEYYFNAAHGIDPHVWLYPASEASGAAADIIQTVSDGVGLYNYTAHCSHSGHGTPSFTTSDIPGLTNYHQYLLGIGNCCESNTFGTDYSTDCFGEAFLKVADKGGIGYIGGSNSTYWDEDYWWGVGYGDVVGAGPDYEETTLGAYDGVFHDHGEAMTDWYVTNSAIIFAGNMAVSASTSTRDTYYWEIYHLMGDPSVITYMGVPTVNNVSHDATCLLTTTTFTVDADPGSYVGISVAGELQGAGYVDQTGSVDIELVGFSQPVTADIVVTCQNRQPYIGTFQVIAPSGPYVLFDSYTINDAAGNGNGLIEIAETIGLGVQLVNVGPDDALNVQAVITTTDPYVTITNGTANYGTIAADFGTLYLADAFTFDVSPNAPDGHEVLFDIAITGTARDTWYGDFEITVHAPIVDFVSVAIDDASGDNNGVLDPGETVLLTVSLQNTGSVDAPDLSAVLSEGDAYITVGDDYGYFGTILAENGLGDNRNDEFEVTADPTCPTGYLVTVGLTITAGNYQTTARFDLTVGDRAVLLGDNFSTDKGWAGLGGDAEWTIGPCVGAGGDPVNDYSHLGDNQVLGNDLTEDGQYNAGIAETDWVTSPVIDCSNITGVILSFYRWLGVEGSGSDHAYFEVFDGTDWVNIFENGTSTMTETEWTLQEFDLGTYADHNPAFMIRFGLGSTSGSGNYCGWNIDDLELKGYGTMGAPEAELVTAEITDSIQPGSDPAVHYVTVNNIGDGTLSMVFTPSDDWLGCSSEMQIVPAGESVDFEVSLSCNGMLGGVHEGTLSCISNEDGYPQVDIPVYMYIYEPDYSCNESNINMSLAVENQADHEMTVNNYGEGTLLYAIGVQMDLDKDATWIAPTVDPLGYRTGDPDKTGISEAFYPPVEKGAGGPDAYGYQWRDSDEAGGPVYDWIDISTSGTEITDFSDDNVVGPISLGFSFPMYDSVYTEIYVSSNGYVLFDESYSSLTNYELPTSNTTSAMIAMWWDDIDPPEAGNVYYYYDATLSRFILSWEGVRNYLYPTGTGSLTFQLILNANGKITLQYNTMDPGTDEDGLAGATVGLQCSGATDGLSVVHNAEYMHDQLALDIFAANWMSIEPASGSIDPYGQQLFTVHFDAAGLEEKVYTGRLMVSCNDGDTPTDVIEVQLNVGTGCCVGMTGNVDCDEDDICDIGDLTKLIQHLFIDFEALCCPEEANVDGEGDVDIGDITELINHLMITFEDMAMCQ